MDEFDRIIVGTDGSDHADIAVDKALSLAQLLGKPLLAIYVIDPHHFQAYPPESLLADMQGLVRKEANESLQAVADRGLAANVDVETQVREGRPSEELCGVARPEDLIVVATHGRRGLGRILLGSVAENVVRHAPCPVLVIRDPKKQRRAKKRE